jgi:hypothetical protein
VVNMERITMMSMLGLIIVLYIAICVLVNELLPAVIGILALLLLGIRFASIKTQETKKLKRD